MESNEIKTTIKIDKSMVDRFDEENLKIKITHGIYHYNAFDRDDIYCRNTNKYLPIPLKFRDLLLEKYLQWWRIRTSIYRFNRRIPIRMLVNEPLEFTMAHEPNRDIKVISIVHPFDVFKRKIGTKIVKERMEWALKHLNNNKRWCYRLT